MAVAAMAWVEGSPYSTSTRVSSLTTGGDGGRGSFSKSFINWPMYITIWERADDADVGSLVDLANKNMLKDVRKYDQHGLMDDTVLLQNSLNFKENPIIGRNIITASSQCRIKQDNSWTVVNQGAK